MGRSRTLTQGCCVKYLHGNVTWITLIDVLSLLKRVRKQFCRDWIKVLLKFLVFVNISKQLNQHKTVPTLNLGERNNRGTDSCTVVFSAMISFICGSSVAITLVSMSMSMSLEACTPSSMFWPHTRPISSSSCSCSTQSNTLLSCLPSSSKVKRCCTGAMQQTWNNRHRTKKVRLVGEAAEDTSTRYWFLSMIWRTEAAYCFLCTVRTKQNSEKSTVGQVKVS